MCLPTKSKLEKNEFSVARPEGLLGAPHLALNPAQSVREVYQELAVALPLVRGQRQNTRHVVILSGVLKRKTWVVKNLGSPGKRTIMFKCLINTLFHQRCIAVKS